MKEIDLDGRCVMRSHSDVRIPSPPVTGCSGADFGDGSGSVVLVGRLPIPHQPSRPIKESVHGICEESFVSPRLHLFLFSELIGAQVCGNNCMDLDCQHQPGN